MKCMKYIFAALFVLICEQSFGKYIAIGGAVPMLTFCFAVSAAAVEKELNRVIGLAAGLGAAADMLAGHGFGTYTVIFVPAALVTFIIHDRLFSSKRLFLFLDMLVLTFLAQSFYYLVHISEIGGGYQAALSSVILPIAVYNAAVTVIFYPLVKRLLERR